MKKMREWIYENPSIRVPVILLRSNAWKGLSYSAGMLYLYMRASLFDQENGYRNTVEDAVKFGPSDAGRYGMDKKTYYRALAELLECGIVKRVENGRGGKKAVFNLLSLEWVDE